MGPRGKPGWSQQTRPRGEEREGGEGRKERERKRGGGGKRERERERERWDLRERERERERDGTQRQTWLESTNKACSKDLPRWQGQHSCTTVAEAKQSHC